MIDKGQLLVTHGIEQDQAAADDMYGAMSPSERGELLRWLCGKYGDIRNADDVTLRQIVFLASMAFMETGLRRSEKQG